MKTPIALLIFTLLLTLSSCQFRVDEKQELMDRISYLEENLYSTDGIFNMEYANELIESYETFADSYPDDPEAAENLFKAANISINFYSPRRTLSLLEQIITEHADFENAGMAKFLQAFVYDSQVGDTATAHRLYQQFITEHPQHNFVEEAQIAIRNLGKSAEDLIREFETMNIE